MPLAEAIAKYDAALKKANIGRPLAGEPVPVGDALGRVTSEAVIAKISSPFYHSAAMDGYAVRFIDTFGAGETRPKRLAVPAQAVAVDTGDPMPDGYDAVIMIEDVEKMSGSEIEILKPATPWQHVRLVGEDIVATELIISENHDGPAGGHGGHDRERPHHGHGAPKARRSPIIPTGTELVEPGSELKKGDIIDFNSTMLAAMATECGAHAVRKEHRKG